MVSFQRSGDNPAAESASQPPLPQPESGQPRDDNFSNARMSLGTNQHGQQTQHTDGSQSGSVPMTLQPALGSVSQRPAPQIQPQSTGSSAETNTDSHTKPDELNRIPSILRPGRKSPNLNPFRNREGNAAAPQVPTDAMSNMHVESPTNNPWSSALSAQRTRTPGSDEARSQQAATPAMPAEFQQDPWSKQFAVELDATPIAHPSKPLSVPTPEEQSIWGADSQNIVKSQFDSQSTLVKPTDEFSQIFDDQHAWDDLGRRTPQIKRSETNKTAGEDSDQDDWNMIDSETSSIAGDVADKAANGPKQEELKAEPKAKPPPSPGMETPPTSNTNTLAILNTDTLQATRVPLPSTPYVDAPTTPWDEPKPPANDLRTDETRPEPELQRKEESAAIPAIPLLLEPKDEVKQGELLIEPIGYEPPPHPPPSRHEPQASGLLPVQVDDRPALPPRQPETAQRWSPTRQPVDGGAETYQIKKIRWKDPNSNSNTRVSPILVQNENGPCPLVALVNALSLTTPEDSAETTLVQVLRSRERISLNLVLDAVFDELMSPRRTSSEDALPDISELYEFLQSLHTGMNVNPRFIPTEQMIEAFRRSSLTHLPLEERDILMPGTFENSLEMKLYATFSIPLIHGWLPAKSDPAYGAFERQAATYEDAQNLLFREEELETKLSDPEGGLSGPEQQLYQDVMAIKMFMNESATQLTAWGIHAISKAIRPGTFAILFRNDHFSTLYCHPSTMQLLTLVTDAGYSSHEEVVWESLEDVNGEMSGLYSGDFRPVGSSNSTVNQVGLGSGPRESNNDSGTEWTRVQNRRGKDRQQEPDLNMGMWGIDHEQEDRDLALALQLQEEEEQREREEQERRRQESRLSEQFIEQQGRQQPRPVARDGRRRASASSGSMNSPRRSSSNVAVTLQSSSNNSYSNSNSGRRRDSDVPPPQPPRPQTQQQVQPLVPPAVNRPADSAPGEEAPPSYEAAQHDRRYVPTTGQPGAAPPRPPGPQGAGGGMMPGPGQGPGSGAAGQRPGGYRVDNGGYHPARPHGGRVSHSGRDRDRDCVVM